jgi:hypothetical protein
MIRRLLFCASLLAVIAVVAVGCGSAKKEAATTTATTTPTTTSAIPIKRMAFKLPVSPVKFAAFTPVPLLGPSSPAYAGPATPHSLADVQVVPDLEKDLKQPGVTEALEQNGFVIVPSNLARFYYAYEGNEYSGWPVYVTTDVAYHEWHLVFDKTLRDLEQQVLLPKLDRLVSGLLQEAQAQTNELKGSSLEDSASRVEQLFQVAAAELGQNVSLGKQAEQEKALIDQHSQPHTISPILGTPVDYSLFTPRGHYTLNAQLTRYFVAMSVLGQLPFCLPGTKFCEGVEPARMGILASRVLVGNPDLVELWRQIYEPSAFLVGVADDYTPLEVEAAAKATPAGGLDDAKAFESDAAVNAVVSQLIKTRPVQINPEYASIRLMGTRFVLDSYILDQLIAPNVGTESKPRLTPSALDLAASFGSGYAKQLLDKEGVTAYANYTKQLAKVQKVVAGRPQKDWGSTVYDAWLYALQPMFVRHSTAFPDYMRNDAWTGKALQTGFGSYAELKHDTILYTKQSFAEGGGTEKVTKPPRNWVEPDPVAFGRLVEAMKLLQSGLSERSLLTPQAGKLLSDEIELLSFFERIAKDELAGKPISTADNNRLRHVGGELEALWWRTGTLKPNATPSQTYHDAVIADISSSPKGVLEIATGRIDWIYVIVPDDHGNFQLAVGGVYSYYEFLNPPGQRLTDQEWRAELESGKQLPARPTWESVFLPGANIASKVYPPIPG